VVLPGTKPEAATTPEIVVVVGGGLLACAGGVLSLFPPQAASTQAAAIEVRRGVERFIELIDIVGGPCWLHVLLFFASDAYGMHTLATGDYRVAVFSSREGDLSLQLLSGIFIPSKK
jgi:hypothetical protein